MNKSIAITGRLQKLSVAELEAVFGADKVMVFSDESVFISQPVSQTEYARLGGSLKVADVVAEASGTDWTTIENLIREHLPRLYEGSESKVTIGVSVYGFKLPVKKLQKFVLSLKKELKSADQSVRVILNKSLDLSTAEVYHNKLSSKNGIELVVVTNGHNTCLARTRHVQDIDSYVRRDRGRPMRDARVGMLPPKLAQTIINLAAFPSVENTSHLDEQTVLDPFCGTGVVLQEALLMGYKVYGTDLEPRMVDYTQANLKWLMRIESRDKSQESKVEVGDATVHHWHISPLPPIPSPLLIACETYLGPPLTRQIPEAELSKMIYSVNKLHEEFLINLGEQVGSGTRLCLAVPAWRYKNTYKHLPTLEKLGSLGYNWVDFKHVDSKKLIYDRPDQFVARQLITLVKT